MGTEHIIEVPCLKFSPRQGDSSVLVSEFVTGVNLRPVSYIRTVIHNPLTLDVRVPEDCPVQQLKEYRGKEVLIRQQS